MNDLFSPDAPPLPNNAPAHQQRGVDPNWIQTPPFRVKFPHLISAFAFDPQQCAPKYSVQANIDVQSLDGEDAQAWGKLTAAVNKALAGKSRSAKQPFIDNPDGSVRVNMSCMKRPPQLVRTDSELVDSDWKIDGKKLIAFVDITTYNTRVGVGAVLGLRAWAFAE